MEESEDYRATVKAAVMDEGSFIRMTLSRKVRRDETPWVKIVVRPVEVKARRRMQFSFFDPSRDITKNYPPEELDSRLDEVLAIPFGDIHIQSTRGDIRVRVDRKGVGDVSRSKPSLAEAAPDFSHDRVKGRLLPAEASDPFLREIGIADGRGNVRAAMQGKFRQISEFLRTIEQTVPKIAEESRPMRMVDCGCGNAYLTFAAYHYLADKLGLTVELTGVDTNAELVERNRSLVEKLGWPGIEFRVSRIAEFEPEEPPDVVLSLHACDTATDEAIAKGILWESRVILAAPCCQHELHDQLKSALWQPVLRHGILKERLADIVTDALRALVLRIVGYRTDVIQFVDPEHTAKNLLIRAEKGLKPGDTATIRQYRALKESWGVTPAIEAMLGDRLALQAGRST
jgi:SAM-dependent methyltransferase